MLPENSAEFHLPPPAFRSMYSELEVYQPFEIQVEGKVLAARSACPVHPQLVTGNASLTACNSPRETLSVAFPSCLQFPTVSWKFCSLRLLVWEMPMKSSNVRGHLRSKSLWTTWHLNEIGKGWHHHFQCHFLKLWYTAAGRHPSQDETHANLGKSIQCPRPFLPLQCTYIIKA